MYVSLKVSDVPFVRQSTWFRCLDHIQVIKFVLFSDQN